MPRGRRIAFDPIRGRLWVVCGKCFRWTLQPLEDREAALYELERAVRDLGTPVAETANVGLYHVGRVLLIRVGPARLAERAWWQHGRELRRRRASFDSTTSRVTAYTFGTLQRLGDLLGLSDPDVAIHWDDNPMADILRWRRFGWAAWHGRVECPYCNSTLRALSYDLSWWVYPLLEEGGSVQVGVPCPRCDPWTPDNIYRIEGPEADTVLRRVLAYQNISGATEGLIREASRAIEDAGSAGAFTVDAVGRRQCLWKMGRTGAVALEIALAESSEDRILQMEARAVEFLWRREEELARIMDEELTPRYLLRKHLRRLPVRVSPGRTPRILRRLGGERPDAWEPGRP
ncbi:MAG: hypothetical protein JSU98_07950 [Gemmatimonadales bacterium]|jgi:hypothetical protein|nr:MAG: hypothetical protein JSU98_07950 [Gemmatimonadales bacterium]